jgi:hypothetical protein
MFLDALNPEKFRSDFFEKPQKFSGKLDAPITSVSQSEQIYPRRRFTRRS